jgi:hypothetical protein
MSAGLLQFTVTVMNFGLRVGALTWGKMNKDSLIKWRHFSDSDTEKFIVFSGSLTKPGEDKSSLLK